MGDRRRTGDRRGTWRGWTWWAPAAYGRPWRAAWAARAWVILGAAVAGCGPTRPSPAAATPAGPEGPIRYEARVAPNLDRLAVRACFDPGDLPLAILPGRRAAARRLLAAWDGTGAPTRPDRRGALAVRALRGAAPCVSYAVALEGHAGGAVTLPAGDWLWAPRPPGPAGATLRLIVPEGLGHSVPFEAAAAATVAVEGRPAAASPGVSRIGDGAPGAATPTYRLPPAAFGDVAHTAFGALRAQIVEAGGSRLRVAVLPGAEAIEGRHVEAWLGEAARAAALLEGALPVRDVQVLVRAVPGADGDAPVAFGLVGRGAGPSVLLLVRQDVDPATLVGEWVAVHELVHLVLPRLRAEDAWLTEGLATYYQEVLRARAGWIAPVDAFRALDAGFARGRAAATGRPLRVDSRELRRRGAYHRVYWAGAAFALALDLALRADGGDRGVTSLDAAVPLAREAAGPSGRTGALAVGAAVDRALDGTPFVVERMRGALDAADFPPVEDLFRWAGLGRDGHGRLVAVDPDGPWARITQPAPPETPLRPRPRSARDPVQPGTEPSSTPRSRSR